MPGRVYSMTSLHNARESSLEQWICENHMSEKGYSKNLQELYSREIYTINLKESYARKIYTMKSQIFETCMKCSKYDVCEGGFSIVNSIVNV